MKCKLTFKNNSGTQTLTGYAQEVNGKLWTHFRGQTFVTETKKTSKRRKSSEGKSTALQIHAPMPGKITKLLVAENQSLDIGQSVVVMEAMKMEYTLKCETTTKVEKILVQVGEQVQLGQLLVTLAES